MFLIILFIVIKKNLLKFLSMGNLFNIMEY